MGNRLGWRLVSYGTIKSSGEMSGICRSDDLLTMKDFGPTQDLAKRAKAFALDIIRLSIQLPKTSEARVLGQQLVKSGTSWQFFQHPGERQSLADT